jgi:hypothetical protein
MIKTPPKNLSFCWNPGDFSVNLIFIAIIIDQTAQKTELFYKFAVEFSHKSAEL